MVANDDVSVLAQQMIKKFPADAADQATLRSKGSERGRLQAKALALSCV